MLRTYTYIHAHTHAHAHTLPTWEGCILFLLHRGLGGIEGRGGRELMLSTTTGLFVKEFFKAGQSNNTNAHFQNGSSRAREMEITISLVTHFDPKIKI